MINKKICAICLTTSPPMLAKAAWKDGELFIADAIKLPDNRHQLEQQLIETIHDLEQKGFEVLVDESSDFITARAGVRVRLGDAGASGKPVLVEALDIYRELVRQKAITFPRNAGGRFNIPDTLVDVARDAKGSTIYRIDWEQLRGEHSLTMLCTFATTFNNVASVQYLEKMLGFTRAQEPASPLNPLRTIVSAFERQSIEQASYSPLTGKGNYL
ncbi:maturation control protein [Nissabacter sp. SGAir0207]|uniref:maturation control protein n=1 Tax=Nissabacter sp. SGAir0207 TaxID=2126321 RepID=UPI0010CD562B|nr:maturation control protein [Nissabacter sp. SGAir0207]QCR38753.1 maturation control protein [Nissabacter sp. SGAir0207]